jgi:hypothetical protein
MALILREDRALCVDGFAFGTGTIELAYKAGTG